MNIQIVLIVFPIVLGRLIRIFILILIVFKGLLDSLPRAKRYWIVFKGYFQQKSYYKKKLKTVDQRRTHNISFYDQKNREHKRERRERKIRRKSILNPLVLQIILFLSSDFVL